MLKVEGHFNDKELEYIKLLNRYFAQKLSVEGKVIDRVGFVRYEVYVGNPENNDLLVLQFQVREDEDDFTQQIYRYTYISNILIPFKYRRKGIATDIISIMLGVSEYVLGVNFYITGIVNDEWKKNLVSKGGIEDEDGDILINPNSWIQNVLIPRKDSP